ncbi:MULTISPECIES: serine hydrolase domain-containing protein [unclassified Streptomyces]|uniref:serine hydrolase domain-containing protein n=1 Tax=unclassified Streptomyces TaxID=2593676 RepID=UPI0006AF4831|nr:MULTISPECIES: serine hydrolase domain-containing protein [unclassified Streptomyces]KOU98474.1 beta-lactamase [Streptomyces sp. XY58]KOV07647.1 beta-lactamase [Streptomyces sp. XY37]KOV43080.1 beta-lactamase [Streptomyces sp. MMG1064]
MDELAEDRELLPTTRRALRHRIAVAQSTGRAPSVVAAVLRAGEVVWEGSRTSVEGHGPDGDVQYRIGSISKTFTAVLVMRLREEGLLRLDDLLEQHLPGTAAGRVTIAQLLAHTGGLAAETPGEWWERTPGAQRPELVDVLGEEPFKLTPGSRHHYSNPGYTLLGSLVEALRGRPWEEVLRAEVLEPLGLDRTSGLPQAPHAGGWAVHPWADVMMPEPLEDLGLMAAAGQLWSTTRDLARFADFLLRGDERVLSAESVREMRRPASPPEPGCADLGYGLGVQLMAQGARRLAGHSGSLPGFVAGLWLSDADDVAAVVLANCTSGLPAAAVAADLVGIVADAEPPFPRPWRPFREADQVPLEVCGPWYWGTSAQVVRLLADGSLELAPVGGTGRTARFRSEPDGSWTGLSGYYTGETLRAVRREDGSVSHLDLASFVFTREPYDPAAPVPGGVDPQGWRGIG